MRKLALDRLDTLFAAIAAEHTLYLPVDGKAGAKFEKWEDGKVLSDVLNTVRSPKDFFFPQTENLMDFKTEGKKIEIIDTREECEDFVIFGVRACDVRSFEVLDRVFLAEPADSYYENRRKHGILVSLACNKPLETCFCGTFGIDAAAPEGDIVCHKTADALYLDAKTEKGEALLKALEAVTEDADAAPVEEQKAVIRERLAKLPLADLSADAFGVLPPVSILTPEQTKYYFLSGFTAKLAGTERGITEPTPTFSACFGQAFLELHPTKYAEELVKKMEKSGAKAYLVNTGWNGTGKRISIKDTRGIIDAILNGDINKAPTKKLPYFDFEIPTELTGVATNILDPRDTYADAAEWDVKAKDLASRFIKNFAKYEGNEAGKALVAAGPQL